MQTRHNMLLKLKSGGGRPKRGPARIGIAASPVLIGWVAGFPGFEGVAPCSAGAWRSYPPLWPFARSSATGKSGMRSWRAQPLPGLGLLLFGGQCRRLWRDRGCRRYKLQHLLIGLKFLLHQGFQVRLLV